MSAPLPARRRGRPAALALALAAATLALAGCDGAALEGTTGPGGATVLLGTGGLGGSALGVRAGADLVGRWTRVSAATPGVLTEVTFTFLADGSGARTTVTRTALGAAIAVDQAPFGWSGGGGSLLLRFARPGGGESLLRAGYAIETGLEGTTLRLDGASYARASG